MMGQIGTPAMLGVEDPTKIPTEEGAVLLRRATLQPHSLPNQAPWRVRVPPLVFGTMKASAISTHAQSRFASAVLDGVLTSATSDSEAHLAVSFIFCSSGSNTRGESQPLEGRLDNSKSPPRV